MTTAVETYSPWPDPNRTIEFNFRPAVWVSANPFYGDYKVGPNCPEQFKVRRFWFPFFTVNTRWFHFYLGWKPINLEDPKFYWRELVAGRFDGTLFVQLSARWGKGSIS